MNSSHDVTARIAYISSAEDNPEVRAYAPQSGRAVEAPENAYVDMLVEDVRSWTDAPSLDVNGFEFHNHTTFFSDFYDEAAVRRDYYPEVAAAIRHFAGATEVFVFDHNVRSAVRAAAGQPGVRAPVDGAHNDYTETSGPERVAEILEREGRTDLLNQHAALINLWRPIIGPVLDVPLAVCDARSTRPEDFVDTRILHFADDDLKTPRHVGHIYSLRHGDGHRWAYLSAMQTDEILLLKGYDSLTDGTARFVAHTGFKNPACPDSYTPRESIEARTLAIFDAG
jgi:hypothetical protein